MNSSSMAGSAPFRKSENRPISLQKSMEEIKTQLKKLTEQQTTQSSKSQTPRLTSEQNSNSCVAEETKCPKLESKYSDFSWPPIPKGREIDSEVSNLFANIFEDTKTQKVQLDYDIPRNCIVLAPPTLKHEIWVPREKELHLWQRLISQALIAEGHALSSLGVLFKSSFNFTDDQQIAVNKAFEKIEKAVKSNFALMHKLTEERHRNVTYKRKHERDEMDSPRKRYSTIPKREEKGEYKNSSKSGITSSTGLKLWQK